MIYSRTCVFGRGGFSPDFYFVFAKEREREWGGREGGSGREEERGEGEGMEKERGGRVGKGERGRGGGE